MDLCIIPHSTDARGRDRSHGKENYKNTTHYNRSLVESVKMWTMMRKKEEEGREKKEERVLGEC